MKDEIINKLIGSNYVEDVCLGVEYLIDKLGLDETENYLITNQRKWTRKLTSGEWHMRDNYKIYIGLHYTVLRTYDNRKI